MKQGIPVWIALLLACPVVVLADGPATTASIRCDWFVGVSGHAVDDLLAAGGFPGRPARTLSLETLQVIQHNVSDCGYVVRGYVHPPATGNYVFHISSDDAGVLLLSPSENADEAVKIAECPSWTGFQEWSRFPQQKSRPVPLTAGKKYYILAMAKGGGGPNHLSVGWELPGGKKEMPIPGARLSPADALPKSLKMPASRQVTVTLDPRTRPATRPGQHKFILGASVSGAGADFRMSYLIRLPEDYASTADRKPLLVFLHGNTHQGTDIEGLLNEGPAQDLNNSRALREWFPLVLLVPQCPPDVRWDSRHMAAVTVALIDRIVAAYRIDPDRVYLSGLSMGGKGTWLVAMEGPDRFAAIAPLCAVEVDPQRAAQVLAGVYTWIIVGSNDGDYTSGSRRMYQTMKNAGCPVELTIVPGAGHDIWSRYYPDPKFYERLLAHRRPATRPAG